MHPAFFTHIIGVLMRDGPRGDEIRMVAHNFSGTDIFDPKTNPNPAAHGSFTLVSNGDLTEITTVTGSPSPAVGSLEWHRDNISAGLGDDWEVRATLTAGTTPTINTGIGTFLRIDSSRQWGNTKVDTVGTITSTLTLDYRLFGDTIIQKTITGVVVAAIIV